MKLFVEALPEALRKDGVSVQDAASWAAEEENGKSLSSLARLCSLQANDFADEHSTRLGARLGEPNDAEMTFDAILCSEIPMNFGIPVVFKCERKCVNLFKVNVLENCRSFYKHSHAMPNFYMAEGSDMDADLKENGYGLVTKVWFSTFGKALPKHQAAKLSAAEANIRVMCGTIKCDDTPNGRMVYAWVRSGKLRSGSIGFEVKDVMFIDANGKETDDIWEAAEIHITESFLGEFSACGEGKNHGAFLFKGMSEIGRMAAANGGMSFNNAAALAVERGIDMKKGEHRKILCAALGAAMLAGGEPFGKRFKTNIDDGRETGDGGGGGDGKDSERLSGDGENKNPPKSGSGNKLSAEQIKEAEDRGRLKAQQELAAEQEKERLAAEQQAADEERARLAQADADKAAEERLTKRNEERMAAANKFLEEDERAQKLKTGAPTEFAKIQAEVARFGGATADSLKLTVAQTLADVKLQSGGSLAGLPSQLNVNGDPKSGERLSAPTANPKGPIRSVLSWKSPNEDKGMPAMQRYIQVLGKIAARQGLSAEEHNEFEAALNQRVESYKLQNEGIAPAFKAARMSVPSLEKFTAGGGMFLGDEFFRANISPEMLANLNEMCYGQKLAVHPNKLRLAAVQGSDVSAITHEPVMSVADYFWAFAGALSHQNPRVEYITGKPKFGYSLNRPQAQEVADPEVTETFAGRVNQSVFSLASKTAEPCMIATRLDFDVTPDNLILSQDFDTIPRAMMAMAKVMALKEQELLLRGVGGTGRVKGIINVTGVPGSDFVTPADKTGQVALTAEELTALNKHPNRESLRKAIASVIGKDAYVPGNSGFITHTYLEQLLRDRARSRDNPGATAANNAPATKDLWVGMEGDGVGMLMDHKASATTDFVLREDATGADSWVDADGNVLKRTDIIYSGCWQEFIVMKWTVMMMADWFDPKNVQEIKTMWTFLNSIVLRNDPFYVLSNANVTGFADA